MRFIKISFYMNITNVLNNRKVDSDNILDDGIAESLVFVPLAANKTINCQSTMKQIWT